MELLEECGDAKSHVLTTTAVSDELLCGMRIVLANTSDVERFFDEDDIGFKTKILVSPFYTRSATVRRSDWPFGTPRTVRV